MSMEKKDTYHRHPTGSAELNEFCSVMKKYTQESHAECVQRERETETDRQTDRQTEYLCRGYD